MIGIRKFAQISAAMLVLSAISTAQADGVNADGFYSAVSANPSFKDGHGFKRGAVRSKPSRYNDGFTTTKNSTWYMRIDGAYAIHDNPGLVEDGRFHMIDREYDSTWSLGAGLGGYFSPSIRGDLTYDFRFEADVNGTMNTGGLNDGQRTFELSSHVILANIYYDFNRGGRFNPYLGVGLGGVYHETEETVLPGAVSIGEGDGWHIAAAFMAGAAMKVAPQANLDVGYRFLYLGEVETGAVSASTGSIASDITAEDLHAHEFRVGLRYDIN